MELLEYFYEHGLAKNIFYPRKVPWPDSSHILIQGPRYCGKFSYAHYHLLQRYESNQVLWIDCEDFRYDQKEIETQLIDFIEQKGIAVIVFYGIERLIAFPQDVATILVTHHHIEAEGFEKVHLDNLDFEEFILFEKKYHDPKVLFNSFLKNSNFPEIVQLPEYKKRRRFEEIYRLTFKDELTIFAQIALFQGHTTSVYFLFNRIRQRHKISKDRFYSFFDRLIQERLLFALDKFDTKRAPKKLFFHNFLTKSLFSMQKEFPKIFENMVFLELRNKEIFYLEPLGFYLPKEERIVLAIPFGNETRIQQRIDQVLAKNRLEIKKIEVVTVGSSFSYELGAIYCEIVPFYEWALGQSDE